MKKIIFLLLPILVLLVGCSRDDDFGSDNQIQPVPFTVTVKYDPSKFGAIGGHTASGAKVKLTNTLTGDEITGTTDQNGELKLTELLPGTYNITTELTMTKEEYESNFGLSTNQEEINFGGSQEKVIINANNSATTISITSGRIGDLVIKQYYYAGSNTRLGASFRDQFIEIYNNSDQTIYADGLSVILTEGNNNSNPTNYTLPNGQYDWSQTAGGGNSANTDYVYANTIITIPGEGTTYPIEPGKSIIIAQTGINHKAPYDDLNGESVSIQDPTLTVDLSNADFEVYLGDYNVSIGKKPYQWDIQNIAVPDMKITHWSLGSNDMLLNVTSYLGIGIIRATASDISALKKYPNPKSPTGSLHVQIPVDWIIDGMDITDKEQKAPKDFPATIDATRAFITENGLGVANYTGYSLIRKTKETIQGRIVLQDTNNSQNDFVTIKANPRGYAQ